MGKFLFVFKNAVLEIFNKKTMNFIVLTCIMAGLLVPLIYVAKFNYLYKKSARSQYKYIDTTIVIDSFMQYTPQKDLEKLFSLNKNIIKAGTSATSVLTCTSKNNTFTANITGITQDYIDVTNLTIVKGRGPTQAELSNAAKVCIVNQEVAPKYKIGTIIKIGNASFEIIGVFSGARPYGNFVIPYTAMEQLNNKSNLLQYVFLLNSNPNYKTQNAIKFMESNFDVKIIDEQAGTAVEMHEVFINSINTIVKKDIFACTGLVLLSFISFVLIVNGNFLLEKYKLGVKLAMGLTDKMLFAEMFLQSYFVVQLAVVLDYLIIFAVHPYITQISLIVDSTFYIIGEILCIAVSILITATLFLLTKRKSIVQLINE